MSTTRRLRNAFIAGAISATGSYFTARAIFDAHAPDSHGGSEHGSSPLEVAKDAGAAVVAGLSGIFTGACAFFCTSNNTPAPDQAEQMELGNASTYRPLNG